MISVRLDPDILEAMRKFKAAVGVPVAVQIEKAATAWLSKQGVTVKKKTASRRASTRRKA